MRRYVQITGLVFALITLAHIARAVAEPAVLTDPIFLISSGLALGLAGWALRLILRGAWPKL